jgi:hypothetical protein
MRILLYLFFRPQVYHVPGEFVHKLRRQFSFPEAPKKFFYSFFRFPKGLSLKASGSYPQNPQTPLFLRRAFENQGLRGTETAPVDYRK